jgi:hypothetical protein
MRLSFIQSNWLRQYPFQKNSGIIDVNLNKVPTDILVGLRLMIPYTTNAVYVNKLTTNAGQVSIEFCTGTTTFLGSATGVVTNSNTTLPITTNEGGSIGTVTIGNPDSCQPIAAYFFNSTIGLVEPSTITRLTLPGMPAWKVKSALLTGAVTLSSDTIAVGSGPSLALLTPLDVASREDYQPNYLTCQNSVIGSINNVLPDSSNNLNIVAIEPLKITALGNGMFSLTLDNIVLYNNSNPRTGPQQLCINYNIPPDNETSTPTVPLTTATAEYPTWPQFQAP